MVGSDRIRWVWIGHRKTESQATWKEPGVLRSVLVLGSTGCQLVVTCGGTGFSGLEALGGAWPLSSAARAASARGRVAT